MKFEDYVKYAMKYVWVQLPYTRNPRKAKMVGIDFENERLLLRYETKYGNEAVTYHDISEIITPEQYQKLHLPELWDQDKKNVKEQRTADSGTPSESGTQPAGS